MFCIRARRLVKAARRCAAQRSRALTSLGAGAALLLGRNASAWWLSVDEGTERALRKNAGSPQGYGDHQNSSGKGLPQIADGKPASRTEDAGVENCGRERPGTPQGVLAPKNGDKTGSLPATVWIFPRPNFFWFQLRSSAALIPCIALAI